MNKTAYHSTTYLWCYLLPTPFTIYYHILSDKTVRQHAVLHKLQSPVSGVLGWLDQTKQKWIGSLATTHITQLRLEEPA